jgi:phosphoesterase RecJ-like protein
VTESLEAAAAAVPDAVVERLSRARCVLAITHENPDADTLGASLGVQRLVARSGGSVTLVSGDPVPRLYDFLPGIEQFRSDPEPEAGYDLLVASDFGTPERMGSVRDRHTALLERLPRVTIDHHVSSQPSSPADWIDPGAAATCEMVALLALRLGVPLTADEGALATVLMAGIVMDTATFAHPNTTPRTLSVASALVEAGAPLSDISRRLYRSKPEAQLRLFGRVLERLESVDGGRVVWSTLLHADLAATGAEPAHSEGIIDLLAQAENAEVAILFKEADGQTRLSVRTRPDGVDAAALTGLFGGGGHARAAGATIELPVAEARSALLRDARRLAAQIRR